MKAVGIKQLKDNLSRYLALVREGALVLVTDRDEVIAEIHKPVFSLHSRRSGWELFLETQRMKGAMHIQKRRESLGLKESAQEPAWPAGCDWEAIAQNARGDRI